MLNRQLKELKGWLISQWMASGMQGEVPSLFDTLIPLVLGFSAMIASICVVPCFPLSAAPLILSYPVMHFWDLRFTYDNLYLSSEKKFRRVEQNIPLVAFERRFEFKWAAFLNALWSLSIFLFLSFFFSPVIIAPYLGVTLSPLTCSASGAAFLAAVHAHALTLNRIRSVA